MGTEAGSRSSDLTEVTQDDLWQSQEWNPNLHHSSLTPSPSFLLAPGFDKTHTEIDGSLPKEGLQGQAHYVQPTAPAGPLHCIMMPFVLHFFASQPTWSG